MKRSPFTPQVRRMSARLVLALVALGFMCTGAILGAEDAFRLALAISLFAAFSLALLHNFRQAQAASRRKRRVNT
jgi:hypothetical protein